MSKGYAGRRNYISCSNMIYSRDLRKVLIFTIQSDFVFVFEFSILVFVTKVQVNPGQSFIGAKHLKVIASTTAIHLN